jgi:hypothetical protein
MGGKRPGRSKVSKNVVHVVAVELSHDPKRGNGRAGRPVAPPRRRAAS